MLRHLLLICLCFIGIIKLSAQSEVLILKLRDKDKNPIPAANVYVNNKLKCISNEKGVCDLELDKSNAKLTIKHVAFADTTFLLKTKSLRLNVTLKGKVLKTVNVTGGVDKEKLGIQKIDAKNVEFVPTSSGDFINATLSTQMGVATNNELSASYSVRGGSYDENLVYVNGIEVYRPFLVRAGQQEGLSFINSNLVENIEFSAGGFAANYGDKLSSVLDVKYKAPKENGGGFEVGLLGGNVFLENNFADGKVSQVSGIRFRRNSSLLRGLESQGEYNPTFFDLQSYWTIRLSDKSSLSLLGQFASNTYNFIPESRETEFGGIQQSLKFTVFFDGQEASQFMNGTGAVQFKTYFNPNLSFTSTASYFRTRESENFDVVGQYFLDELDRDVNSETFGDVLQNLGVGGFLNHARNEINAQVAVFKNEVKYNKGNHTIRAGVTYKNERIEDRINEWVYIDSADFGIPQNRGGDFILEDRLRADNRVSANRFSAYVSDEINWYNDREEAWNFNYGIRFQHYDYSNSSFVSPRASISYLPVWRRQIDDSTFVKKHLAFRLSGGSYNQNPFYRELRQLNGVINPTVQAQRSWHAVFGIDYELLMWKRPFLLTTEIYNKWLFDLVPYELENVRQRYYGENLSDGYARGIDLKLNGEFVKGVESWITLSFLKTEEDLYNDVGTNFVDENGEVTFPGGSRQVVDTLTFSPGFIPRPSDQRFRFGMYFADHMPKHPEYKVYLSLQYGSALPYGPPNAEKYKAVERSESYKRIDIGFSRDLISPGKKKMRWLKPFKSAYISLDIFNIIDANNLINYTWVRDVSGLQYAVPNRLTGRRINVKFVAKF